MICPPWIFSILFFKFWLCWMFSSPCRLFLYLWPVFLISAASLAAEHWLQGPRAPVAVAQGSGFAAPGL